MTAKTVGWLVVDVIMLVAFVVFVPNIVAVLGSAVRAPAMPIAASAEISTWLRVITSVVAFLVACALLSRKALAAAGAVSAVAAIFAAAILTDQIGSHWPTSGTDSWPTADQAAILGEAGRWTLGGIVLLIATLVTRQGVWSEVLVCATGLLAAVVVVLAAKDQIDGHFATPADPIKSPTLTLSVRSAELIGAMPSPPGDVQLFIVTPQRDADGHVTGQETKAVAAKIVGPGCQNSALAVGTSPSPTSPAEAAFDDVRVDCSIEISRGEEDASILDLLGRIVPDGRVLIAPR